MSRSPMPDEQRWDFWYRLTARVCLVWGASILLLAALDLRSRTTGVDGLQLAQSFTVAGVALVIASGALWIRLRRFTLVVVLGLVVAAMPLADFAFVFRRAAMLSPAGSDDAWAHTVSLLAVVLTPLLLVVASVMLSLVWVQWHTLEATLEHPTFPGESDEQDVPWQPPDGEEEAAAWNPDPLRITSVLAASIIATWIAAKVGIHMSRSDFLYRSRWPDVALLGSVVAWPVGVGICFVDRRARRFVRWFAIPLVAFSVLLLMIAFGLIALSEHW